MSDFVLIDLASQREAVRALLHGRAEPEILAWLRARGRLTLIETSGRVSYEFESVTGRRCQFCFLSGDFVFVGDHTTFI